MQASFVSVWQISVSGLKEKWEFSELLHAYFSLRLTESAQPFFSRLEALKLLTVSIAWATPTVVLSNWGRAIEWEEIR